MSNVKILYSLANTKDIILEQVDKITPFVLLILLGLNFTAKESKCCGNYNANNSVNICNGVTITFYLAG